MFEQASAADFAVSTAASTPHKIGQRTRYYIVRISKYGGFGQLVPWKDSDRFQYHWLDENAGRVEHNNMALHSCLKT